MGISFPSSKLAVRQQSWFCHLSLICQNKSISDDSPHSGDSVCLMTRHTSAFKHTLLLSFYEDITKIRVKGDTNPQETFSNLSSFS